jgi:hypothetical protein
LKLVLLNAVISWEGLSVVCKRCGVWLWPSTLSWVMLLQNSLLRNAILRVLKDTQNFLVFTRKWILVSV